MESLKDKVEVPVAVSLQNNVGVSPSSVSLGVPEEKSVNVSGFVLAVCHLIYMIPYRLLFCQGCFEVLFHGPVLRTFVRVKFIYCP